jgi:hypothetical protein
MPCSVITSTTDRSKVFLDVVNSILLNRNLIARTLHHSKSVVTCAGTTGAWKGRGGRQLVMED